MAMATSLPTYHFYVYGCLSVLEFTIGTPLNILCLLYFVFKTEKSNSRLQYIVINVLDIIICINTLPIAITAFSFGKPMMFSNTVICTGNGMLWNIASRLSVFLIAELSVTRSISTVYPLRRISRRAITTPILAYTVLLFIQATIPFWFNATYNFRWYYISCIWSTEELSIASAMVRKMFYLVFSFLEFFLPAIPIVGSSVGSNSRSKRSATVTVILLTFAYFICNIVYIALSINYTLLYFGEVPPDRSIEGVLGLNVEQIFLLQNLTFTHSVALNSMINALVYFCRIKEMKTFGRSVISYKSQKLLTGRKRKRKGTPNTASKNRKSSTDTSTFGRGYKSESESTYIDMRRVRTDSETSGLVIENRVLSRIRTESEGSRWSKGGAGGGSSNTSTYTESSYDTASRVRMDTSPRPSPIATPGNRKRTISRNSIKEEDINLMVPGISTMSSEEPTSTPQQNQHE